MKRFLCLLFVLALFPVVCLADLPDISDLSFDELVQLRQQLNLAIWNSEEWQEVTVPIGVWKIGEDIPAGKWTITMSSDSTSSWGVLYYCDQLENGGTEASSSGRVYFSEILIPENSSENDSAKFVDVNCTSGNYIVIERAPMVFSPFAGKPDLGFK